MTSLVRIDRLCSGILDQIGDWPPDRSRFTPSVKKKERVALAATGDPQSGACRIEVEVHRSSTCQVLRYSAWNLFSAATAGADRSSAHAANHLVIPVA